jgi:hypothetical protein
MHVPPTVVYPPQVALTLLSIVPPQMHATLPIAIAMPVVFSRMLPAMIIASARTTLVMTPMVVNTPISLAMTTTHVQRIFATRPQVVLTHQSFATITQLARPPRVMSLLVVSTQTTLRAVIVTTSVIPTHATMFSVVPVFPSVATILMPAPMILVSPQLVVLIPRPTARTPANVTHMDVIQ